MKKNLFYFRAFTIVEILITIALMIIVLAIAVPAFTSTIQNNYSLSITHTLLTSLRFARSEAIRRNTPVTVCATADANFNSCGNAWNLGWIIFTDVNSDGTINSGTDSILRIERLTGNNAVISTSPSANSATYNNMGFPVSSTANLSFSIFATGCTGDYARTATISFAGQVNSTTATCP